MNWSKIPDFLAIASLTCAFFSISRQNPTPQHRLWLIGWIMVSAHFLGLVFGNAADIFGIICIVIARIALIVAGGFFIWATAPSESEASSRWLLFTVLLPMSLYFALAYIPPAPDWSFQACAVLICLGPLIVVLIYLRRGVHTLHWLTVGLQLALGIGLIVIFMRTAGDVELGMNLITFVVYLCCCVYFWYTHRAGTAGSIITIGGFFTWAIVFIVSPWLRYYRPAVKIETGVWNLPKYVVAIGMLLLLLEKQIERTQHMALHDELTKLANRRLFQDRLSAAIERARRSGASIALLQVDLDRFKQVNDTLGHHFGDLLLRHVAVQLLGRVRHSDTVARTGGDEFSIILEELASRKDAELVADSLANIVAEPFQLAGKTIQVGASVGIAVFPEDAQDFDSLCIEADLRMYQVKLDRRGSTAT